MAAPIAPVKPTDPPENPPAPSPAPSPTDPPAAPAGNGGGGAPDPFAGMSQDHKDRMLSFYMRAGGEQEKRIRELTERVERVEAPKPPTPDSAAQTKGFYDRPVESVTEIVKREINEAIAPLKGFVQAYSTNDELSKIKNELRGNPSIARVLDVGESYVDNLVSGATSKGAPLTREMVMGAISSVKGGIDLGWIQPSGVPAAPAPAAGGGNPVPPNTPPHLRPSAPPAPAPGAPPKLRDLSEEERRLARENKMSDAEYLKALDMPAGSVTNPEAWKVK